MDKGNSIDFKQIIILIGMFVIILIFWNPVNIFPLNIFSMILYPLKIFVVLLHELSHGLAAILTGGRMHRIELNYMQGGATWSTGGMRLIILPAGYLGSMLWGGLILVLASKTNADKLISKIIGFIVIFISIFFIRPIISFGFIYGIVFGSSMIALGILAPRHVNDLILKFIGLVSILYAILDIKDDLISRTVIGSDAYQMSKIIPLPPIVWGIIWIIMAIIAAVFFLKIAARKNNSNNGDNVEQ